MSSPDEAQRNPGAQSGSDPGFHPGYAGCISLTSESGHAIGVVLATVDA